MNPWTDYRAKLVEIAERIAQDGAKDNTDFLRRFRTVYRHLVVTVDGAAAEMGQGPFGPMGMDMGMRGPDINRLMTESDQELDAL